MKASENAAVPLHFHSRSQRESANQLGMWALIATEVLFFGGLFLAYVIYRASYPDAFAAGSRLLDFRCGTINTAVLLTSSLTIAMGDAFIKRGRRQALSACIACTAALGLVFLGIKSFEYRDMYQSHLVPGPNFTGKYTPQVELFVFLYFATTGLHAIHMIVGLGAMAWLYGLNRTDRLSSRAHEPVKMVGMYWHFVDCIWVILYPLLYLIPK
jgi:cytochrome c oxidase subunit 3